MKEKDSLEQFIVENREAFDDGFPNPAIWSQIDQRINRRAIRRMTVLRTFTAVAAGIALLLTGALAGSLFFKTRASAAIAVLERTAPEFLETERYYQGEIQRKVTQLAGYAPKEMVLNDLEQLDQVMEELKEELVRAPRGAEQEIVSALIRSYQMKLSILELVMERLDGQESLTVQTKQNETSL